MTQAFKVVFILLILSGCSVALYTKPGSEVLADAYQAMEREELDTAEILFQKSLEQAIDYKTQLRAAYALGKLYLMHDVEGEPVPVLEIAEERGSVEAKIMLAVLYRISGSPNFQPKKSKAMLTELLREYPDKAYRVGRWFERLEERDVAFAAYKSQYYEMAAAQGDEVAVKRLRATILADDDNESGEVLTEQAQWQQAEAWMQRGLMLQASTDEGKQKEAERWLERAANIGYAAAEFQLGLYYLQREDTPENQKKSRHWLGLAKKHGYIMADEIAKILEENE